MNKSFVVDCDARFCLSCVIERLDIAQTSCCTSAMELDHPELLSLVRAPREQAADVRLYAVKVEESISRTRETIRTTGDRIRKSQEVLHKSDQLLDDLRRVLLSGAPGCRPVAYAVADRRATAPHTTPFGNLVETSVPLEHL
jgi:hypothetical protein